MKEIKLKFALIKDDRHQSYIEHNLCDVLILVMCAVLCGYDQLEDIVIYGQNKIIFLKNTFGIDKIPSKPTLSRILNMVNPEKIGQIIIKIIINIMCENVHKLGEIIAVDGKAIRRTSEKGKAHSALQILTAYCTENGVVIGQKAINHEDKTNEIPVFKEMLDLLDISGKTITADALHCQKETCKKIVENGGNYCFSLKQNQPNFYQDVDLFFKNCDFDTETEICVTTEKHNGRCEERICYKFNNIEWIKSRYDFSGLESVFAIKRVTTTKYGTSEEVGYYISSTNKSPESLMKTVREHWKIESLHWLLDVVFSEDECNLKGDGGQKTMNSFRNLALVIHKNHIAKLPKSITIKRSIKNCLLTDERLIELLGCL